PAVGRSAVRGCAAPDAALLRAGGAWQPAPLMAAVAAVVASGGAMGILSWPPGALVAADRGAARGLARAAGRHSCGAGVWAGAAVVCPELGAATERST